MQNYLNIVKMAVQVGGVFQLKDAGDSIEAKS